MINFRFLSLFVLLILINIPFFDRSHIPRDDTFSVFEIFYFFYNHFYFHHEIAAWNPYNFYGMPTGYGQLMALSPPSYLCFLVGTILKITDTLFLFKLSILLEQCILLFGMYLLCEQIYKYKFIGFLVCLSIITSANWYSHIHFNLRILYLLPLIYYLFLKFFLNRKVQYFWLGSICFLISLFGNPAYFLFLWIFILFFTFLIFIIDDKTILNRFESFNRISVVLVGLVLLLTASLAYIFYDARQFSDLVSMSRQTNGANDINTFLVYGEKNNFSTMVDWIFLQKERVYIGILPVLFYFLAFYKINRIEQKAFLIASIVVTWVSFSGIFSVASYYFPGMAYYRHLGHTYGIIKILVLISAGFGLENYLSWDVKKKTQYLWWFLFLSFFFLDGLGVFKEYFISALETKTLWQTIFDLKNHLDIIPRWMVFIITVVFISSGVYVNNILGKDKRSFLSEGELSKIIIGLLGVVFIFDLFASQRLVSFELDKRSLESQKYADIFNVNKPGFQMLRENFPNGQRQRDITSFIERNGLKYVSAYGFMQWDVCHPEFRVDFMPKGVERFINAQSYANSQETLKILGCQWPKLRIIRSANNFQTIEETQDFVSPINVDSFSNNEVTVRVNVASDSNAWLVYADSFHPGWQVFVNGQKKKLYEIYLAFKGVSLEKGTNIVRMTFRNSPYYWVSHFIAFVGLSSSVVLLWFFLQLIFKRPETDCGTFKDSSCRV